MKSLIMVPFLVALASARPPLCGFDVAFVLDSSESITEINFAKEKKFVQDFIVKASNTFGTYVGPYGVQGALVPFGTFPSVSLHLSDSKSLPAFYDGLDQLNYKPGLTNTAAALDICGSDVFVTAKGDRPEYPNILILLTDGLPTKGTDDPVASATALRKNNDVTIISVGIPGLNGPQNGVFYDELVKISGDSKLVFNATSWSDLFDKNILQKIISSVPCPAF